MHARLQQTSFWILAKGSISLSRSVDLCETVYNYIYIYVLYDVMHYHYNDGHKH